jgi:hypothetical protein
VLAGVLGLTGHREQQRYAVERVIGRAGWAAPPTFEAHTVEPGANAQAVREGTRLANHDSLTALTPRVLGVIPDESYPYYSPSLLAVQLGGPGGSIGGSPRNPGYVNRYVVLERGSSRRGQ